MQKSKQKQIFDSWLQAHKGILFKVTRAYAFTPHDQDDLFQEICLRVWRSVPDFRGDAKVSTWVYSVALYAALSWSRQERKHEDKTKPLEAVAHTLVAQEYDKNGRLNWLYDQIGQLSEIDRSLCLLMLDGYSYAEIAKLLNMSPSNVGVKIHRIKQQLVSLAKQEQVQAMSDR
ncbi:MAG: RNA polymerase sigma factor [Chloroflexota bacterium]